jgi:hypothetical protein
VPLSAGYVQVRVDSSPLRKQLAGYDHSWTRSLPGLVSVVLGLWVISRTGTVSLIPTGRIRAAQYDCWRVCRRSVSGDSLGRAASRYHRRYQALSCSSPPTPCWPRRGWAGRDNSHCRRKNGSHWRERPTAKVMQLLDMIDDRSASALASWMNQHSWLASGERADRTRIPQLRQLPAPPPALRRRRAPSKSRQIKLRLPRAVAS